MVEREVDDDFHDGNYYSLSFSLGALNLFSSE